MQRGKDRQSRGARQPQTWACRCYASFGLKLIQQLLILRKFANFIENRFHIIRRSRFPALDSHRGSPYISTEPLYLFIALFKPSTTNASAASAARSTTSERVFISSREKSCSTYAEGSILPGGRPMPMRR